jgi:type I restriction enzyme S subunit
MIKEIPKLIDYCIKISSGGTPCREVKEYYENGSIPWVKSKELKNNIILDTEEKITSQGLKYSSTKMYPIDTVLLAMYGVNIGQVGYLGIEASINQAICGIITNKKILDPKYLYYYLTSIPSYFNSVSFGAAQQNINQDLIKKLKIEIPELPIQQRIVSILSAYDELIEINNQRIEFLEETARELFKEWFVRMSFLGFKKVPFAKGLPKGWEVVRIDSLYKTSSGGTPSSAKKEYYESGIYNWVKTGELNDSFVFETDEKITVLGLKKSATKLFPPYTTIFAM